jgi:hypothetical protein
MTANSAKWKASFEAAADTPKADDVRRELRRLLESLAFRDSLRLTCFLKFVVEAVLEGKGDRIKSYTIAVEALGRGSAFDPQTDPIVRVEAGRLRRALARYYATTGCNDSLVIEIPRGAYVPTFRWRDADDAPKPAADAAFVGADIAPSARAGNLADQRGKLSETLRAFHTLAAMHRLQIAAVKNEIANARRTLKSSYALLKLAATGPAPKIGGTEAGQRATVPSQEGGTQPQGSRTSDPRRTKGA